MRDWDLPTLRWCFGIAVAIWITGAPGSLRAAAGVTAEPMPAVTFDAAAGAAADLPRLHSLLVSHHGKLVFEGYYNGARATRPVNIKSASNSIISALVGIAIGRGLIQSPRQPIALFFPQLADLLEGDGNSRKGEITIEDLLSMRAGLETTSNRNYGRWVRSSNWVRHILSRPFVSLPGTSMEYSTGNTHLLSAILSKVTGLNTWQFAQESLARPLGFTLAHWPQDPQGVYFGGNDMLLTPRQMVAFGELYLNRGRANGQQIIPAEWVYSSLIPRVRSRRENDRFYGYGWWIRELAGQQTAYAWGFGGQFVFVVPKLDLVVVTTSATTLEDERRSHRFTVLDLVERFIIAPIAAAESGTAAVQVYP